ncbi:hypothetical protein Trydic_g2901 [Trypoxylus dichotomus]
MLPTSGLFKDIDCPYYDNYCGRPYCHFRHRKRNPDSAEDSQDGESTGCEFPTYKPTPKSQLAQAKSHIPISYVPDTVVRPERLNRIPTMFNYMEKITYKPTPLSELSKNNTISTTAELINKELLSKIAENKIEEDNGFELKDNGNCDIDFEELSPEFDMIDDIINESPHLVANESQKGDKETKNKLIENKSTAYESNKSSHSTNKSSTKSSKTTSSSSKSSKDSSSKSKDDKSKQSKSSSTSSNQKSSHKSKSDKHRSRSKSKDRNREKSLDKKPKDDKKQDKQDKDHHKSSSSKSSSSKDKKQSSSSRSSSKDKHIRSTRSDSKSNSSSSKHKEYDKSKRKEKSDSSRSSSKEKQRKDSKTSSKSNEPEKKSIGYSDDDQDADDLFNEDLEEECYRIFNEYKPETTEKQETQTVEVKQHEAVEEYVPTTKKRIAHMGAEQYVPKVSHVKVKASQNAAVQMANRYKIARETQMREEDDIETLLSKHGTKRQSQMLESYQNMKKAKTKDVKKEEPQQDEQPQSASLVDDIINGNNKTVLTYKPTPISKLNAEEAKGKPLRIAPAMNVFSIQQAKARIAEFTKKREMSLKTPVQTIGKGNKRVAHIPDASLGELPDIIQPESKKIPANVRTRYLTMIADECVKLYLSKEDAYSRAVNEEFKVLERCAAIVTYRNSAMLTVNRIRKEVQARESKGLGPISSDESAETNPESQYRGKKFYANISRYILSDTDLEENGYPREGPIPGKAVIKSQKQLPRVNLDDNQRLCCRCFKVYLIDAMGYPMFTDDCIYHPLKKRTLRGDRIYLCCKSSDDTGCVTSNTHVSESDETELLGYQTTMEPESDDDARSSAVYALDCEMCYTTKGLELTRVTIIDPDCKTVYESLVKPLNPIIDYNTQFSGITKDQMDRTSTNILQVQANILHLCNSKTILIGHSLESDMKALKIVHSCVIDTAILFPHRLGLPHKRALRALASEYLTKIIQSDVAGHDSAEDAITCMELVIWKLKEELKVKGVK